MKKILQDWSFRTSIILTIVFFGAGILFLILDAAVLSWVIFFLLPIVLGISIGALPNRKWALWGALLAAILTLICVGLLGLSGFICIIFTVPLAIPFIFLGSVITYLAKRYKKIKSPGALPVLLLPLIPFLIAAPLEKFTKQKKQQVAEVRTEQIFNATPEEAYDAIISVDTLIAEEPLLMKFDLPIPVKCVLEKREVGGLRTCHFKEGHFSKGEFGSGTITERITQLQRGKVLKMDVIDCNIIGRKWLGFKEAIYYFDKVDDNHCKVTRITTYTSELSPRFYWEPLEKLGIRQEHEYVFRNLENDLQKKNNKLK